MDNLLNNIKTEQIGADLSKVVDRVSKQYDQPDIAFQKEAIQNSWDERIDIKSGNGWSIKIYKYTDETGKTHIVVEDFGTNGMNLEKWESFSSLWKPKKSFNESAGGKGQGKFILMNASMEHILFVESNSNKGYICKFLQDGKKGLDNEHIDISLIVKGVKPLDHKGTKIWVFGVKEEFLKTLESEEFYNSIVENWWQVLSPRFNGNILLLGKKVSFLPLPPPAEEILLLENFKIDNFGRIKRFHLGYYPQRVPPGFEGVLVQRANMTICKIPFEVYDKSYQGKFSGFIEFDKELEQSLKDIERNDHSNFLYETPWKEIKSLIRGEADKFVAKIVPSKENKKSINIKNLSEIIQKTNQIINEFCPEITGGGSVVPPIKPKTKPPIRIKNLSINKREAKWNDTINIRCSIINNLQETRKVFLKLTVKKDQNKTLEEIYSFKTASQETKYLKISEIKLVEEEYPKGKYIVRATLSDEKQDLDTKSTSFYLEEKRESVKKGFIKDLRFADLNDPAIRNMPVKEGVLTINFMHKDYINIESAFENKPQILTKQVGYYLIKLCLDEAARILLLNKITDNSSSKDIEDTIQEVRETQDRMYYEVYA